MEQKENPVVVYEGNFIRFLKRGEWEYVQRNNCTSVVIILAMTDDQKILFVDQYRPPVRSNVIELPAGLVNDLDPPQDQEESILEAAKRELFEETGYQAEQIEPVMHGPISSGFTSDMVSMVRAKGLTKKGSGGGDSSESITVHEIPLNEAESWLKTMQEKGWLIEPKIYAGLYFLKFSGS